MQDLPHESEMSMTAERFGKWRKRNDRKVIRIVLSPSPSDHPKAEDLVKLIEAFNDRWLPNQQAVAAIHFDAGEDAAKWDRADQPPVMHAHITASTVDMFTGRIWRLSPSKRREIQDWCDRFCKENFNWMIIDRSQIKTRDSSYSKERKERLRKDSRERYIWTEDLRGRVLEAYTNSQTFTDFYQRLKQAGVGIITERKDGRPRGDYGFFFLGNDGMDYCCGGAKLAPELSRTNLNEHFRAIRRELNGTRDWVKAEAKTERKSPLGGQGSLPGGYRKTGSGNPCAGCTGESDGRCERCQYGTHKRWKQTRRREGLTRG